MKKRLLFHIAVFFFSLSCFAQFTDNVSVSAEETTLFESRLFALSLNNNFTLPVNGNIAEELNGKALFSGSVRGRKLNGNWQSWYDNGMLCDSGTFVRGLPDGEWKHWNRDGKLMALRTFSADKFNRVYNELLRYNPRRISFPLTTLYHQNKASALKYFKATYSFGTVPKNKDDMTLPQLIAANITPGNDYQPVFDHGLHHGLYINYFSNGITRDSGYYKNGLRDGVWIQRDQPGASFTRGSYNHGTRVKGWRTYDDDGKLVSMHFYNNRGQLIWKKNFQQKSSAQ
jgi:antitoxin component YwqK of YwqJK toxin-antitoxin module